MEKKVCNKCGEEKLINEFYLKNKNTGNLQSHCIKCQNEYKKKYREENKQKISDNNKKYREDNLEKLKRKEKSYYIKNKEIINERVKKYYRLNREKCLKTGKDWVIKNRDRVRSNQNKNKKRRCEIDIVYRLGLSIRSRISESIRCKGYKKNTKTYKILGCDYEKFKIHLEGMFEPWMSWDNFGLYNGDLNYGWDIDHIIPLSSAKTEEDLIRLNHYTNLQPLCSRTNRYIKKDRLDWSPE